MSQVTEKQKSSERVRTLLESETLLDFVDTQVRQLTSDHEQLSAEDYDAANSTRPWARVIQKLTVLIPMHNERWTIQRLLQNVLTADTAGLELEVVVVDDGSDDGCGQLVQEIADVDPRLKLLRHEKNAGKGAAVRTAIGHITGDVVIIQDADLEYDPADFPQLLEPILSGDADAVYGSRFSGPRRRALLFWNSLGNKLLTLVCNAINNLNLTDMSTGYKVIRADILRELRLQARSFSIEPELTTRLAQWGARIYEVPISYRGRSAQDGKKTRAIDGLKALGQMLRARYIDTRFTLHTGMYVLRSVEKARSYNGWIMRQIGRFLGNRVAEAGAGIGNMSQSLADREHLLLIDHDPMYVAALEDRFQDRNNVRVLESDLTAPGFENAWQEDQLDSVFCSNVLEHLGPHREILQSFQRAITPGGHCVIIVPAEPALYNGLDTSLGHHRRYRRRDLKKLMEEAGFNIVHDRQVCKLGALAWFINGKILRRRRLTPRQMLVFDRCWPLMNWVDRFLPWRGMSLIMVGQKPATAHHHEA